MSEVPEVIVVGHDGSPFANEALKWALSLAEKTGHTVTVVRSWTITSAPRPSTWERGFVPPESDFAEAVRVKLAEDIANIVKQYPDIEVALRPWRGPAANALVAASEDASMIVLGPRGLGGFKGLVLGSVSEQVVRHAKCPVVVVRSEANPAHTERTHSTS